MEVTRTFVSSCEEYKDTVLQKIICGYDFEKNTYGSTPYSINGWPLFHKLTVYVGKDEILVERPYAKNERPSGSTTYPAQLIKVPEAALDEVKNLLNIQ